MVIEDIINLAVNNGLSVLCVCYLIYFQHTTMEKMSTALNAICDRLTRIETLMEEHEHEGEHK